jgi:hypothetical protein
VNLPANDRGAGRSEPLPAPIRRWRGPADGLASARMTPPRTRPPFAADERTQITGWLDLQRALVRWKCAGLSELEAHRPVLPESPLMTMAGVVSHLRWVEVLWFEILFLGRPGYGPDFDDEREDADMIVDDVPLSRLLTEYDEQCAVSRQIVAEHSLDDVGRNTDIEAGAASLRWMVLHMLEETARHVGHLDAIRELLDGRKGYY